MEGTGLVAVTSLTLLTQALPCRVGQCGWSTSTRTDILCAFNLHTALLVSPCIAVAITNLQGYRREFNMAGGRSDHKCGEGKKDVANNDEALFCDGNCKCGFIFPL